METIEQEKINNYPELRGEDRTAFANWVVTIHRKLHNNRTKQIELAKKIDAWRAINQDTTPVKNNGKYIDGFRDSKFSTMCFIDKAQVSNESWTNIDQMYSIVATDTSLDVDQSKQMTEAQKFALDKAMKDNKIALQFDKAYTYYQQWGEMISWVGWKQKTINKKVATKSNITGFKDITIQDDNANMTAIDPMFFEFDVASYKPDEKNNWDNIIKIHKRFETVDKIANTKYYDPATGKNVNLYKLSKDDIDNLKQDTTKIEDTKNNSELAIKTTYGNSYEVLFLHGNFTFKGKEYKNYIAEVFAGQYLIRFCPNPYYINPFVIEIPEQDPKTKRGIAKMKAIIYACEQRQNEIAQSFKIGRLNTNPPVIGSKQAIAELLDGKESGRLEWEEGLCVGIDDFATTNETKPVTFSNEYVERNIAFISNEIADNGGINANAMGNIEKQDRKATDLNLAKAGQDTRLSQTLDSVYKFIIKNIEAIADILALFKIGSEIIRVFDKKQQEERLIEITDMIRQAHYQYEYQDRNALTAKRAEVEQVYPLLEKGAQAGIVDAKEALKMILEVYGFDNTEKIFKQDDPLTELTNQIPQQFKEMAAQYLQQGIEQFKQQQAQQQMQQQVEQNAQRKIMQQQADEQANMQMLQAQGVI